jgi:hypothetical protein
VIENDENSIIGMAKALESSIIAIDDWLHLYAPDICDDIDLAETTHRIENAGGPLAYIAKIQDENRKAITKLGRLAW